MTMSNPIHPTSQTPQQITLAKLKQLIPEAFSEGQLDIRKLTALLSEQDIAPAQEAYGLSWAGKHQVYRELKTATSQTLVPAPDESVDFDKSQNLFIEGDNLAVLKILQKSYHSRIKMIYIDPPYNTGNDRFVYADDFSESIADYKARAGQTDEDGNLTHSDGMRGNRKENGQYHSNWLNMMYPRLALAKSLLRDDGVIFVSIDDNEVANLRLLMDEIFGEENFVAEIVVASNSSKNNSQLVSVTHEYILIYGRSKSNLETWKVKKNFVDEFKSRANAVFKNTSDSAEIVEEIRALTKYPKFYEFDHYTNMDSKGLFHAGDLTAPNSKSFYDIIHPITKKPCATSTRGWAFSKESLDALIKEDMIAFGATEETIPRLKNYLEGNEKSTPRSILFFDSQASTKWIKKNKLHFSFPKSIELLKHIISMACNEGIILDFFAGSSTTAHAVMALNAEEAENNEAGKRKFIMVQIPEATEADSEAYKAGFSNIAEISKERIRRAAAHITSELPESVDSKALDFGFKAYKLADSNFIPWQQPTSYDADSLMAQLEKHLDPISDNATTDGIITELMLKEGYTLTATIDEADGYYLVTQNDALIDNFEDADSSDSAGIPMSLAIVLDDMTTSKATQIIASAPNKTLIMDRAFSDDANKANIVLQFEDAGLVVGCV